MKTQPGLYWSSIVYEGSMCDVSCRGEQFKQSRLNRTASEYFMEPRAVINLNHHVPTLPLPFSERWFVVLMFIL